MLVKKTAVLKSVEKRLVITEVYVPGEIDLHGNAMLAPTIEKMAFEFLRHKRTDQIDLNHDYAVTGCYIVESWIARKNDPDGFKEGAWVVTIKVPVDDLWEKIKAGDINAVSLAANTEISSTFGCMEKIVGLDGMTETASGFGLPEHAHKIKVSWVGEDSVKGVTGGTLGHHHDLLSLSATEKSLGHSHRIVIEE